MGKSASEDLGSRLDAVAAEAKKRIAALQSDLEASRQSTRERFEKFLPIAERITALAKAKLEHLRERVPFEVNPSHVQSDHLYSRAVALDVKSDLAGVIRLSFRLTHDADVSHILLDYDLQIVPVFFRYVPHNRLDIPLNGYDETVVDQWLDDRIVDFANAYLELSSTPQYQQRVMVSDTVAGISFPKHFAAATLEHSGQTHYFISEETRREFAKQQGIGA